MKIDNININVGNTVIEPSTEANNLGVIVDSNVSMEKHTKNVCRKSFSQLIRIKQLRKYMTDAATTSLVHAFITSNIDYCNSLLYKLPNMLLNKLRKIQHCAARIISKTLKYDNITPVLKNFHWLPVE